MSAFVFSIRGGKVHLWNKHSFSSGIREKAACSQEQRTFLRRAMLYRVFIETVLRRNNFEHTIDLAFDVNDMPEDDADIPIFSFQKLRGAHNPLVPDVDFFHNKWYCGIHDALRYEEKTASACFIGSSTGALLDVQSIRRHETPRLRAATYFHANPKIIFRIANAVQCLSEEAKALLMSQPYFCNHVSWEEQLRHRFIISMDGNGAACSRLVKGLFSNSVVIKLESPYELYYFPVLRAGYDYILAEDEESIERIVDSEIDHVAEYRKIAISGQQFAAKYLTIRSVMDYTAQLLNAFATLNRKR